MIRGIVDQELHAKLALAVGTGKTRRKLTFLIDTGFNDEITLTPDWIGRLKLQAKGSTPVELADGSFVMQDTTIQLLFGMVPIALCEHWRLSGSRSSA